MINDYLQSFEKFGIKLGLESIKNLLSILGNPHHKFPVIHVAGTNGKGSVCSYLSYILKEAGYTVGKYISPHLIDWNERFTINNKPIPPEELEGILQKIDYKLSTNKIDTPTQFEILTAAAFLYFAQEKVDIAIAEVGLGGRLDSTNVFDNPLLTIITSISRDHTEILGETLGEIAGEKAGILRNSSPAIIGKLPTEAKIVIEEKISNLNCPHIFVEPAILIEENAEKYFHNFSLKPPQNQLKFIPSSSKNFKLYPLEYSLNLMGEFQLINSAIAITSAQILQEKGWNITPQIIQEGITKTRWLGRLQWLKWQEQTLLIDGAHNPDAAKFLSQYVDKFDIPIIWVIGILSNKNYQEILKILLKPQDQLYIVPIPNHNSVEPKYLKSVALEICPYLQKCEIFSDIFIALENITNQQKLVENLIVVGGSLYLIGYFLKNI